MRMNKKGVDYPINEFIFILLDLFFFGLLVFFVSHSAGGEVAYEQSYAKEIALILDSAKPGMEISVNVSKVLEFSNKNKKDPNSVFTINSVDNFVKISTASKGGYKQNFFSDVSVDSKLEGDNLILKIGDKNG